MMAVVRRLRLPVFWLALAVTIWMANVPAPPAPPVAVNDKWQHGAAFAVLTLMALAAYPARRAWHVGAAMLGYGVLIEITQWAFGQGRQSEWLDIAADMGGIAVALYLAVPLRKWIPQIFEI